MLCRALCDIGAAGSPTIDDLGAASAALDHISGDLALRAELTRELLMAALVVLESNPTTGAGTTVAGVGLDEQSIRLGVERACRTLAKLSPTDTERFTLIEEANAYRPRTLL
jgi:serine/threonine-protein kinase PknG